MTTDELIKAMRDLADECEDRELIVLFDEAADRLEELGERKRYGAYALFDPDTPEEEMRKTIKAQAADMLEKVDALKIKVQMEPQPIEDMDGSVNFYVQAGWQIQIPSKEVQTNE